MASFSHGSQPSHDREFRKVVTDTIEMLDLLRIARHTRADDAGVDEDWQVEFYAGRIDRIHLRVVDRNLGKLSAGKAADGDDVVFFLGLLHGADRAHDVVGVRELHTENESVGISLLGFDSLFGETALRDLDAPFVHLGQGPFDRIDIGTHDVRHVLEHVLGRELHRLERLLVLVQRPHELVRGFLVFHVRVRKADAEVDDADVVRKAHVVSCCEAAIIRP